MSKRTNMLSSVVREIIAPVLRLCPPQCGIVSITRVDISPDSSYATVYITALRSPEKALETLKEQQRDLQKKMGRMERARIPLLRFRIDTSSDEADRVDHLLGQLSKQQQGDTSPSVQEQGD